jgi:transposase-like protein/IS1 family transposase
MLSPRGKAMNLPELMDKLHSDSSCRRYLEKVRWPKGVVCPACGGKSISRVEKRHVFDCNKCRRQFSATSGTIFHDSHLPLRTWFLAIHRISESKKGVSANQLKRELGVTYKTAWYLCHRIRAAMAQPTGPGLRGIVEVDETYVRSKSVPPGEKLKPGTGSQRVSPVIGMKERNGKIRAAAVPHVRKRETLRWVLQNLDRERVSFVFTDANRVYHDLGRSVPHAAIDHSQSYAIGDLHTNNIESFWALLKRGIVGSYHHVSQKHLQRYVDEYCWRDNGPKQDGFDTLLSAQTVAGPLTYRSLIAKDL